MTPALPREQRRGDDGHDHLDDEDEWGDARRRPSLERGHLAHERERGGGSGGRGPRERSADGVRGDGVRDELRRQPAPRECGAGDDRRRDRPAADPLAADVRQQGERADPSEREDERDAPRVAGRDRRSDEGEAGDAEDDRRDGRDLAGADGLAEGPCAHNEQRDEAERERGLHDGEGREQQRRRLQWPAQEAKRGARQPAGPAQEERGERRTQGRVRGGAAGLRRLQRDAEVVQRRGQAGGARAEEDGRHARPA